ncbi:MAG: T9SS type A sorting domain-containing protein [Bacteroidota bacterium]
MIKWSTGAVLYEINHLNVPRVNLNQTGLNPGVYYIRIIHGNDTVIKKIAIQ